MTVRRMSLPALALALAVCAGCKVPATGYHYSSSGGTQTVTLDRQITAQMVAAWSICKQQGDPSACLNSYLYHTVLFQGSSGPAATSVWDHSALEFLQGLMNESEVEVVNHGSDCLFVQRNANPDGHKVPAITWGFAGSCFNGPGLTGVNTIL